MLKSELRTYNLPENVDDVGVIWESRSGYETAWATPGHDCLWSFACGHGAHKLIPPFLQRRSTCGAGSASLLTPWCAEVEVPTRVNLNRYGGRGSCIPWHCDNQRLFGHPDEPKVIISMSLGHSVLFKLRRRVTGNSPSHVRLDHGDLLVMDGMTQFLL